MRGQALASIIGALALIGSGALAFPAWAPAMQTMTMGDRVTASDPRSVIAAMKDNFAVKLRRNRDGEPIIDTARGGVNFSLFFDDCPHHTQCQSIELFADFTRPTRGGLSVMNDWNRNHRFCRAYVENDGTVALEGDIDLDKGGMSRELFVDNLTTFAQIATDFDEAIYRKGK